MRPSFYELKNGSFLVCNGPVKVVLPRQSLSFADQESAAFRQLADDIDRAAAELEEGA